MKYVLIVLFALFSSTSFAQTTAKEDVIGILIQKLENRDKEINKLRQEAEATLDNTVKAIQSANQQAIVIREKVIVEVPQTVNKWYHTVKVGVFPSSNAQVTTKQNKNDVNVYVTCKK